MQLRQSAPRRAPADLEAVTVTILRWGVGAAAMLMAVGVARLVLEGGAASVAAPQSLPHFWAALVALQPLALIRLGLLILIATPVFRVAAATFVYAREQDLAFVMISVGVLLLLLLGMVMSGWD